MRESEREGCLRSSSWWRRDRYACERVSGVKKTIGLGCMIQGVEVSGCRVHSVKSKVWGEVCRVQGARS